MSLRILPTLLLALFLQPGPANAADTPAGTALANLYEVARLIDAAVLDFNMLLGEEQSPVYKARLDGTVKSLEEAGHSAGGSLATAGVDKGSASSLGAGLNDFLRLMRENRRSLVATGAPEGAVVDEMMLTRKTTLKAADNIYAGLEKQARLAGSPTSEARALVLQLQQMSALYVETAASAGGVAYRTQDDSEATIDELARGFEQRLARLASRAKGSESAGIVNNIRTKWRFIEKSMLNYREHTVPFLVDRYTQLIVADLLKLAETLERGA